MSVYASKRNESKAEFIRVAQQLATYTLEQVKKFPKSYRFCLTNDITRLALEIHEDVLRANSIYIHNTNMFYSVMAGIEEYPYHADGKECTTYNKTDIVAIYVAAQSMITYHTTYNNMLRVLVNRTDDVDILAGITYGMELPQDLAAMMQGNIATAQAQIQKILTTLSGGSVDVKD